MSGGFQIALRMSWSIQNLYSSHGEREGEAPAAWLPEGATQAPVIDTADGGAAG